MSILMFSLNSISFQNEIGSESRHGLVLSSPYKQDQDNTVKLNNNISMVHGNK